MTSTAPHALANDTRRAGLIPLVALAVALLTACAPGGRPTLASEPSTIIAISSSLGPRASMHRTEEPCSATPPTTELMGLAEESAFVVEATITSSASTMSVAGSDSQGGVVENYDTPLVDVKVIARRADGSAKRDPSTVRGSNVDWSKLLVPGRYLFFLLESGAPANGMLGVFRINDGAAMWMCPSVNDVAHPSTAAGSPSTLRDLESRILQPLPTFQETKKEPSMTAAPTSEGPGSRAALACRKALGGGVVSAVATTVAAVRSWGIGPGMVTDRPAAGAFKDDPDSAFAAWCWVKSGAQFTSWGVDGRRAKVAFGTVTHAPGESGAPSGPIGIGS